MNLERIATLIPWDDLAAEIVPMYPREVNSLPPYPLAVMLRERCLQLFYSRSNRGMDDVLCEVKSTKRFA